MKDQKRMLEIASAQLDRVLAFFPRADAKGSVLLAVDTGMLAVLASSLPPSSSFDRWVLIVTVPLLLIGISLWHLYRGAFPTLNGGHDSLVYFREIAKRTELDFVQKFIAEPEENRTKDLLSQVWRNSEILKKKFNHISAAFNWMALAIVPWLGSLCFWLFTILHEACRLGRRTLALKEDLQAEVKKIFKDTWEQRDGTVVPEPEDLKLGNDAVNLDATVLYADMSGSTVMVDTKKAAFSAEVYKSYLVCAARIIKSQGGAITAYDGDRIMAVFIGGQKNTMAVRTAFKINGAVWDIVKPALKEQYSASTFELKHVIGVDTSKLMVSRVGVRNDNDLVWVGRAANYAAKLSSLSDDIHIRITHSVYDVMFDEVKLSGGKNMWQERTWTEMNNMRIYGSIWKFGI